MLTQDAIKQGLMKKADADKVADEVITPKVMIADDKPKVATVDYASMTNKQLKAICAERDIKVGFTDNKAKLIAKLSA